MTVKAILLDIDGTLTNSKKEITPATLDALKKAQDAGTVLVLASGRPERGLYRFAEQLEMNSHHGILICYNGARVTDCETGRVYTNIAMSVEEGRAVLEHMKKFKVHPVITYGEHMVVNNVYDGMIRSGGRVFNVLEYEARSNGYLLMEQRDLAAFADFEINKILTAGDTDYLQAHYEEMREPFKDTLSCMFTSPFYYEFTAKGIDKAKALQDTLKIIGCDREEVIAFGDAQNDRSMLEYAGIGIAMGNADDEIKSIADEITLSNEEDGIAHSLYRYMPELFR